MKSLLYAAVVGLLVTGCSTVHHDTYLNVTDVQGKNTKQDTGGKTADPSANSTVPRLPDPSPGTSSPCINLNKYEGNYEKLCPQQESGKEKNTDEQKEVCAELRTAINRLRNRCAGYDSTGKIKAASMPPAPPFTDGININLNGASTGNIRFVIQSPGP